MNERVKGLREELTRAEVRLRELRGERVILLDEWPDLMAFSLDAKRLAIALNSGPTAIYESATLRRIGYLADDPLGVTALAFSPDGASIAALAYPAKLYVYDANTFKSKAFSKGVGRSLSFTPDGSQLIAGGLSFPSIRIWSLDRLTEVYTGQSVQARAICIRPDGKQVAIAGQDTRIYLLDLGTKKITATVDVGSKQGFSSILFTRKGDLLLAGSYNHGLLIYDAVRNKVKKVLHDSKEDSQRGSYTDVAVDEESGLAITASCDGLIKYWDTEANLRSKRLIPFGGEVLIDKVLFSPDAKLLAVVVRAELSSSKEWQGKYRVSVFTLSR